LTGFNGNVPPVSNSFSKPDDPTNGNNAPSFGMNGISSAKNITVPNTATNFSEGLMPSFGTGAPVPS